MEFNEDGHHVGGDGRGRTPRTQAAARPRGARGQPRSASVYATAFVDDGSESFQVSYFEEDDGVERGRTPRMKATVWARGARTWPRSATVYATAFAVDGSEIFRVSGFRTKTAAVKQTKDPAIGRRRTDADTDQQLTDDWVDDRWVGGVVV